MTRDPTGAGHRRAVAAWCLYDFANSSYTTLIITVAFSVYFREVVVDAADNSGDRLWGIANFLAMLIVALVSPIAGALADSSGRKRHFLIAATLLSVVATALLFFVGPGAVGTAIALYVLGTVGFEIGYVFYNAFLPEVSTPGTFGRVSGWAWGLGYLGGLLSLALCYPLLASDLRTAAGALVPAAIADRRLSFLVVAAFYLVFALPAFFWLRDRPATATAAPAGLRHSVVDGFRRVGATLAHLRSYRDVGRYLVSSLLFTDGITTVIIFSATFATVTFGFAAAELIVLFLVLNVVALPAAVLAGYLADAVGAKRTLVASLVVWIGVVVLGYVAQSKLQFWLMAAGAAIGMGSTQAVSRSFMAEIVPEGREAEFFGFYVLSGKFASIFGPLLFGWISAASGSQRLAVLSLLPLFVAGLLVLLSVDERRARAVAAAPPG